MDHSACSSCLHVAISDAFCSFSGFKCQCVDSSETNLAGDTIATTLTANQTLCRKLLTDLMYLTLSRDNLMDE